MVDNYNSLPTHTHLHIDANACMHTHTHTFTINHIHNFNCTVTNNAHTEHTKIHTHILINMHTHLKSHSLWHKITVTMHVYISITWPVPEEFFYLQNSGCLKRYGGTSYSFLLKNILLFLEKGEGKEKERERNINAQLPLTHPKLGTWPTTQACALTGIRMSSPLVHRPKLNPLSYTSQGLLTLYSPFNPTTITALNIYIMHSTWNILWALPPLRHDIC